jgi:hypothetical protein
VEIGPRGGLEIEERDRGAFPCTSGERAAGPSGGDDEPVPDASSPADSPAICSSTRSGRPESESITNRVDHEPLEVELGEHEPQAVQGTGGAAGGLALHPCSVDAST